MSAPKFIFKNPLTLDTSNVTGKVKGNVFSTREFLNNNDTEIVLSIGQDVATTANVQFSNVTSENVVKIGNIFLEHRANSIRLKLLSLDL